MPQSVSDQQLARLLNEARARVDKMTPEELEAMLHAQRVGYVRAEMSWPQPVFEIIDGAKVYDSYADYCND